MLENSRWETAGSAFFEPLLHVREDLVGGTEFTSLVDIFTARALPVAHVGDVTFGATESARLGLPTVLH